ncbi:hypothetical protein [Alkalinema sp. FACHB-956]|uniref:hypothetical protein n=1 Tax=Alkalinema sp. FACHB-956 TaxID=2692768 RepID=UPI0016890232|nr:hypothetical protein [Alkalinema sp. FACHB-956]MBD2329175.1 hypothetical protein [Alkalinema sp. FACHB-956]
MAQKFRPWFITLSASVAVTSFYHRPPLAHAGGFDAPSSQYPASFTSSGDSSGLNSIQAKAPKPLNFNWKQWGEPFHQGDRICREQQGNLVCLSPQTAQQMGWQVR